MAHLLRRFVCGRCGATAPLSARPYQECASCNALSDYDFGVARKHPDWPAHEATWSRLFARYGDQLSSAAASHDRAGYAAAYAKILGQLVTQFPALFPSRAAGEQAYREQLVQYQAMWQALSVEPEYAENDTLFRYFRNKVAVKKGRAVPATLWPLVDHAIKTFDATQRMADTSSVAAPEDFVPGYIKRFLISVTVAEWLPQLIPDAQRELVTRFGVSGEYVAPSKDTVTCPNCGGAVQVAPGFLAMACPYCSAEIQEARAEYRGIEVERFAASEYDQAIAAVEADRHRELQRLQVLDGEVIRKTKTYRMITLRAGFHDHAANCWEMFDQRDSKKLAAVLAWVEQFEKVRGLPVERLPYREHPKCKTLPATLEELAQRLADVAPGATPYLVIHGPGSCVEVMVDGGVVRLVYDEHGERKKIIRRWLGV